MFERVDVVKLHHYRRPNKGLFCQLQHLLNEQLIFDNELFFL